MENNNYMAMVTLHTKQAETWVEALWLEIKDNKMDNNFRNKLLDLKSCLFTFNKKVSQSIENKDLHEDISANISRFNELIANSSASDGNKILSIIGWLLNHTTMESELTEDFDEKIKLVSDISDKLITLDLAYLKRVKKQVEKKQ